MPKQSRQLAETKEKLNMVLAAIATGCWMRDRAKLRPSDDDDEYANDQPLVWQLKRASEKKGRDAISELTSLIIKNVECS